MMIRFLSIDNILAIADGRNFLNLDLLQGSIPVYTTNGIDDISILGREELPAYLITLDSGLEFISPHPNVDIYPFYTYMKPFSGLFTRYINSTHDIWKTQRFLIWEHQVGRKEYVIPKNLDLTILDSFSNLISASSKEYKKFSKENYRSRSGIHYFKSRLTDYANSSFTSGTNNGNFLGITNEDLVSSCKEYYKLFPDSKNIRQLLKIMREDGLPIPTSFSSYRFGGNSVGYSVLEELVFSNLPYESKSEERLVDLISSEVSLDKFRLNYLKNYNPSVINIEEIGPRVFVKIESENPIAIILKKDSRGFNTEGVFV